jgi:hypothetical protein
MTPSPALAWTCLLFAAGCAGHGTAAPAGPLAPLEQHYQQLRYWDDQARLTTSLARDTTPGGLPAAAVQDSLEQARSGFAGTISQVDSTRLGRTDP